MKLSGIAFPIACAALAMQAPPSPRPIDPSAMPTPPRARAAPPVGGQPWNHDVIVHRVASDGEVSTVATFPRAGVPTAARLADGRIVVAHQHFPESSLIDFDKVAVRFSSDDGATWTEPKVIQVDGLPEGMRFPFDPTLVPLPDGRVRLYFTGNYGRTFQHSTPAIHSAISEDAVRFTYEPGVRFAIEGRPVIDGAVVLHQGVFHLYAPDSRSLREGGLPGAADAPATTGAGVHATSTDGLSFTRLDDVVIEGRRRWLGNAVSREKIVFVGTEDPQPPRLGQEKIAGIWMGTSEDGAKWALDRTLAIRGADPAAVPLADGAWLVAATGPPRGAASPPGAPVRRPAGPDAVPPSRPRSP